MKKKLVLKDKMGQVIRVFLWETKQAYLVYRKNKKRLDICSSPDFFGKDSVVVIDKLSFNQMTERKEVPFIQGFLEICENISHVRPALPRIKDSEKNFWRASILVAGSYMLLVGALYWFAQMSDVTPEEKPPEQKIVKIIKPPLVIKPKKVILGSKQMFLRSSKTTAPKKVLKKSLKKMGALAVLGSLSKKDSHRKGGLNLSSKVSSGPGFKHIAGEAKRGGGVQSSLYSQGMISSHLGPDSDIRGGGGYKTKGSGQRGGQAGYGKLALIGSGGTGDLSDTSALTLKTGGFDYNFIDREIVKHIGVIRQCYDKALKLNPELKGLLKIHFGINPRGRVVFSKVYRSLATQSSKMSSCVLDIINKIHFPVQLSATIGVDYAFDLSILETEGG